MERWLEIWCRHMDTLAFKRHMRYEVLHRHDMWDLSSNRSHMSCVTRKNFGVESPRNCLGDWKPLFYLLQISCIGLQPITNVRGDSLFFLSPYPYAIACLSLHVRVCACACVCACVSIDWYHLYLLRSCVRQVVKIICQCRYEGQLSFLLMPL